jgi:hypothetical protein
VNSTLQRGIYQDGDPNCGCIDVTFDPCNRLCFFVAHPFFGIPTIDDEVRRQIRDVADGVLELHIDHESADDRFIKVAKRKGSESRPSPYDFHSYIFGVCIPVFADEAGNVPESNEPPAQLLPLPTRDEVIAYIQHASMCTLFIGSEPLKIHGWWASQQYHAYDVPQIKILGTSGGEVQCDVTHNTSRLIRPRKKPSRKKTKSSSASMPKV